MLDFCTLTRGRCGARHVFSRARLVRPCKEYPGSSLTPCFPRFGPPKTLCLHSSHSCLHQALPSLTPSRRHAYTVFLHAVPPHFSHPGHFFHTRHHDYRRSTAAKIRAATLRHPSERKKIPDADDDAGDDMRRFRMTHMFTFIISRADQPVN